jgi:hypothetical protein
VAKPSTMTQEGLLFLFKTKELVNLVTSLKTPLVSHSSCNNLKEQQSKGETIIFWFLSLNSQSKMRTTKGKRLNLGVLTTK